jgi:excisionase family DNA binding protein
MPTHLAEPTQDREGGEVTATAPSPMDAVEAIEQPTKPERLAYSVQEAAHLLGVNYFSVYRLVQRGKLKACRALRGKLLVPRSELLKLLRTE